MKQLLGKIPAMIGMLIGCVSFVWYIQSFFDSVYTELWIGSAIMATFSMLFFFLDAIISFVKARKKIDAKFNYILTLVLVGAIPMVVYFGGSGRDFFNVIWNVYYLLVFVLEAISIKKAFAVLCANRKLAKENAGR